MRASEHSRRRAWRVLAIGLLFMLQTALCAPQTPTLEYDPVGPETPDQFAARTQWWRDARFGMFLQWGLYSLPADSTKGPAEWYLYNHRMHEKDYAKLARLFHPRRFDAKKWVQAAREAGMKYIVVTAKFHDGFCMFDSKLTDYTITLASPFKRDPLKELADECARQHMPLGVCYSLIDWHHPDYLPRLPWEAATRPAGAADTDRYLRYVEGQLRELLTHYGPLGVLWFDGGWEHGLDRYQAREIIRTVREVQPDILINDRLNLPEDFDAVRAAEAEESDDPAAPQYLDALLSGRPREVGMSLNETWGYAKNDHNWKSATEIVHKLCETTAQGANFLLNIGPTDQGEFTPEALARLTTVGRWMRANGESLYGAGRGPFPKLPFHGSCTVKGDTLYLQVFQWPDTDLKLPNLTGRALSATLLDGSKPLEIKTEGHAISIARPTVLDPIATVVAVRLSEPPALLSEDHPFTLMAGDATLKGDTIGLETKRGVPNIAFWRDPDDTVSWSMEIPRAGTYRIEAEYACDFYNAGSVIHVNVDEEAGIETRVEATGGPNQYMVKALPGTLHLPAGRHSIRIVPETKQGYSIMNLRCLRFIPAP